VADAVGHLELDGDERVIAPRAVEARTFRQHAVDQGLAHDLWQELVQHNPLVVPGQQAPRLGERPLRVDLGLRLAHGVDERVVGQQHRGLQPGDNDVLVVPGIGDDRAPGRIPRQVLVDAAAFDAQLGPVERFVERRRARRPIAVDGVEIEERASRIGRAPRICGMSEPRRGVERHVVIEELSEEGHACRLRFVVPVVEAQRRIDDECDGARGQVVLRVEHLPARAHPNERRCHGRIRCRERRQVEHAPEAARLAVFVASHVVGRCVRSMRGLCGRRAERLRVDIPDGKERHSQGQRGVSRERAKHAILQCPRYWGPLTQSQFRREIGQGAGVG
jgi:hypothetical protein